MTIEWACDKCNTKSVANHSYNVIIIKLINDDGWYLVATKGSHRQYKHPEKTGRVTIAGHLNDDLAPGTLNSILKQAKLKEVK